VDVFWELQSSGLLLEKVLFSSILEMTTLAKTMMMMKIIAFDLTISARQGWFLRGDREVCEA
jgi:hypothetical protein